MNNRVMPAKRNINWSREEHINEREPGTSLDLPHYGCGEPARHPDGGWFALRVSTINDGGVGGLNEGKKVWKRTVGGWFRFTGRSKQASRGV
jgi:hypothetical protein